MPSSDLEATVFIPTYRGARYIEDLVRSVFAQTYDRDFEVLVYDTDSGDESPAILQRLADEFGDRFRWKSVAKKEFSHGRTRAAAALDAHGEFVAFLTQDATPANGRWLYELLKPFELNERIVAVLGKRRRQLLFRRQLGGAAQLLGRAGQLSGRAVRRGPALRT